MSTAQTHSWANVTFFVDNSVLSYFLYNFHFFNTRVSSFCRLAAASLCAFPFPLLTVHFIFAFMFHLLLSLFLLFAMVDANSYRESTTDFSVKRSTRCNSFFFSFSLCSRFCLPLCFVIAPWLAASMDALCARVFCLCASFFFIFPIFIGVFAVFIHSFFALWEKKTATDSFCVEISLCSVSFCHSNAVEIYRWT